ncbi:glycoside hydrolase domain-containing protein [Streptomyces sp. NPDC101151]|uniref:glycoside hydrolase domain-containing protein n=1 Tax=Streptomyces sp. NPDC101151 TaxID=3366115 RepID=UPI0038008146
MDHAVHRLARGRRAQYSDFADWDQYRAQTQLLALLESTVAGYFAQSPYDFAQQNGGFH